MTTPREAYKNWHEKAHSDRTVGDRVADAVANGMGSWKFIIIQTCIVIVWMSINVVMLTAVRFDPYPFILLNLLFSTQAAYAAPVIMMSQNRAALRDKAEAEHQYEHQEKEMLENTALTREVHAQALQIAALVTTINALLGKQDAAAEGSPGAEPAAENHTPR